MIKAIKTEVLKGYYKNYGFNFSLHEVEELQDVAKKFQFYALRYCNGMINSERYNEKESRLKIRLRSFLNLRPHASLIKEIDTSGDVRGHVLKIVLIDGQAIEPNRFN